MLKILLKAVSLMPFGLLYIVSDVVGFLLYHVAGYRRKVVARNLTECFPEKSAGEIAAIERRFYRFFADNIFESIKLASMSAREMASRMRFPNIEDVNEVLRGGRSISLFMGHYGNWEWVSSMPLHLCKEAVAAQIYHQLSSPAFDKVMLYLRSRMGAVNVEMRQTARWITGEVNAGHVCIVGFIADQSPRKRESRYFIDFLNHSTPVLTGTEKLTKHYGYDAWFVNVRRVERGRYEARFVHMHDNPDSLPDYKLTEIYYRMLEQEIRQQPELYLWTHKRFKYARPVSPEATGEN